MIERLLWEYAYGRPRGFTMPMVTLDIRGIPEVMHAVILRVAQFLREQADLEDDAKVSDRLRQIADNIEAGQ